MKTKRLLGLVAGCGLFASLSAVADEAVWVNQTDKTPSWTNLVNWTDDAGQALAAIPTGTTCNVSFPTAPEAVSRQTIKMDVFTTVNAQNETAIGTIEDEPTEPDGDWSRRLILLDNLNSTVLDYKAHLTIGNPDGFKGLWSFSRSLGRLILPATASYTPKLSHLSAKARPEVEVATVGTKAKLASVFEDGAVRKIGAGELEVGETTGAGTRFYVSEGGLTLAGSAPAEAPETGDDLPVRGAALHLDATVVRSLVTTNETARETGRTFVTKWSDVRNNGLYAYYDEGQTWSAYYLLPYANAPFYNTTDACGHPFVDFGRAQASQNAAYGPTNCLLKFSSTLTNCREIFLVTARITSTVASSPVGDSSSIPFHTGGQTALVSETRSSTYVPVDPVRNGFILFNGEMTGNDAAWPVYGSAEKTELGVVSFGTTNGVQLSTLATDRFYAGRTGGWRLGEVVIFTNVLTTAERYAVHHHLQKKWQGSDAGTVGAVVLSTGASIGVPAGRTAKVTELTAVDGTLVKTGAGTLEVGAFSAKTEATEKELDIRGGSVKITGLPAVSDTAPASGALLWLDATVKSSFVLASGAGSIDYVSEWHDRRPEQTTVWARLPKGPGVANMEGRDLVAGNGDVPTRLENVVRGSLAVVDFGTYGAPGKGGNSFLVLNTPGYSSDNACEAFLVQSSATTSRSAIFGCGTGTSMMRSGLTTQLLNDSSYGTYLGRNAVMTFNGVQVDPCAAEQCALSTGTFDVYSVSAQAKLPLTLVGGKDRIGQGTSFGGCQVGELLLYDRKLTPAERRQTIAYLMKKWQGKTPQFATSVQALPKMTFAADTPAVFDSDADVRIAAVEGSNGEIVKRGTGTVTLPAANGSSLAAISVEDGTLVTTLAAEPELAQPLFRYDASVESSFKSKYVGEDGRTYVTQLGNLGTVTRNLSSSKGNGGAVTNPAVEMVEMRPGVNRPCFDFGYRGANLASGHGATAFHGSFVTNIFEYYAIVADNVAATSPSYQDLCSNISSPSAYFKRGTKGEILASTASEKVRNGYIAVDGVETAYDATFSAGFHLFTAVPTEALPINYVCLARQGSTGGLKMSEMIIYDQTNSAVHRAYIQQKLMHKWFDAPEPTWDFPIDSVSVAAGATWRETSTNMIHVVRDLALAGTVEADALVASETLTLAGEAAEVSSNLTLSAGIAVPLATTDAALTVGGTLTFSGAARVVLDDAAFAQLEAGERTLFAATEIVGFDPTAVSIDVTKAANRRVFALSADVDAETGKTTAVKLRVAMNGLLIIVH